MFFNRQQQQQQQQMPSREVVIYLSPREPAPFAPPFELQPYINADTWNARVPQIRNLASQYQKPLFERAWFFIGLLTVIILPVALFRIVLQALTKPFETDKQAADRYFEARSISFVSVIGIIILFHIPLAIWKFIGARRANALVSRWNREDRALQGPGAVLPTWKAKTPGVFNSQIRLIFTVPAGRAPGSSAFSAPAGAPIPPYLNAPADSYSGFGSGMISTGASAPAPVMAVQGGAPVAENPFKDQNPFDDEKAGVAGAKV